MPGSLCHVVWPLAMIGALAAPLAIVARVDGPQTPLQKAGDRTPPRDAPPNLEGMWTNYDSTPFERLSAAELPSRQPAVSTADWLTYNGPKSSKRTSMVIDPPDGRVPLRQDAKEQRDYTLSHQTDDYHLYGPWERCITRGVPGTMFPGGYNNGYQIIQTADHVLIHSEMIHEARIIPLDGSPHPSSSVRSWTGDSRGHWEGQTLVVDTTNFNGKGWIVTSASGGWIRGVAQSDACHLVERFTLVAPNTIAYKVTIDDPKVYSRPWTVANQLNRDSDYRIFEYACHEANYSLDNMLHMAADRNK
jgi:hypothetical protein